MLAIMKMQQVKRIAAQYNRVRNEAIRLMKAGDLHNYILKLAEVEQVKHNYMNVVKRVA